MLSQLKRKSIGGIPSTPRRRTKPFSDDDALFSVTNVTNGEVVHQSCLLIHGRGIRSGDSQSDCVTVAAVDCLSIASEVTSWPADRTWKALVVLRPGLNTLTIRLHHEGTVAHSTELRVTYQPLLQLPPLYLAILVAKDSPLQIDCPASKYGSISTAHSSLDAAVQKLGTTAFMWQALTAESLRLVGQGRRAFRLEEEWNYRGSSIPKVHIVRTGKSVEEIRALNANELHRTFVTALTQTGGPFVSAAQPAVAGLILDAHYSVDDDKVFGHPQPGKAHAHGISIGMFGSHAAYSWPRSLSEVPTCLLDTDNVDHKVWRPVHSGRADALLKDACATSQGRFLATLGELFGSDENDLMQYARHWPSAFLAGPQDPGDSPRMWNIVDALRFKNSRHFQLPGDQTLLPSWRDISIHFSASVDVDEVENITVSCAAVGLYEVVIRNGGDARRWDFQNTSLQAVSTLFSINDFSSYDRAKPLRIMALARNGAQRTIENAWTLLKEKPYIIIADTGVVLRKRSVKDRRLEDTSEEDGTCDGNYNSDNLVPWTVLLHKTDATKTNRTVMATEIELRVGATFDGAVVSYADGTSANCGPEYRRDGSRFYFGGNSSHQVLPAGTTIAQVEIRKQWDSLDGIRMTLSNGTQWGELNDRGWCGENHDRDNDCQTVVLKPDIGEKIVGFFGKSEKPGRGYTREFGIVVANVEELKAAEQHWETKAYDVECVQSSGRWDGDGGPAMTSRDQEEQENEDYEEVEEDDDDISVSEHTMA